LPQRIITTPIRLTGSVHPQQISSLIAIDALVRRMRQLGEPDVQWELSTLAGDAAVQRAVVRAVAREGEDRELLGRQGFTDRARRLEHEAEADLRSLLAKLSIETSLDRWGVHGDLASRAARVAFVRLYEAGVLTRSTAVVDACPSCATVVDEADTDVVELTVDQIRVALPLGEGQLEIDSSQPELFVGAVAVAVPESSDIVDKTVFVPLVDDELPIVRSAKITEARVVVPAHDHWSFEFARAHGMDVLDVLDAEGIVQRPGVLEGLGRFAARAAATELLTAGGFVAAHFDDVEQVRRCHRCSTVVVPMFGVHWVLSFESLIPPLIEALPTVAFSPAAAADRFQVLVENTESWCISQQLWSGEPIPVATCLDCNQTTVAVDMPESCGSCMGSLQQHPDILDARFVAAIVPLAMLGWPAEVDEESVTLSVGRSGLETWALPIAALGLRLAGRLPFHRLTVHQLAIGAPEISPQPTAQLIEQVEQHGTATVRASLLLGELETQRAHELLTDLANPAAGDVHVQDLVQAYDQAVHTLEAGGALIALGVAARQGLDETSRKELAQLVQPLLAQ
jgi:valyl-tRNA synthetase